MMDKVADKVTVTNDQCFYGFGWTLKRTPEFFFEAKSKYSCEHVEKQMVDYKFCPLCGRAVGVTKQFKLKEYSKKAVYLLADPIGSVNDRFVDSEIPLYLYHPDDKFTSQRFPKPGYGSELNLKNAAKHQEEMEMILKESGHLEGAVFGYIRVGQHTDDGY
jgi:hypothetical protein